MSSKKQVSSSSSLPKRQPFIPSELGNLEAQNSQFFGQARCASATPNKTVWIGEYDGSLCIRAAPSGDLIRRIEPKDLLSADHPGLSDPAKAKNVNLASMAMVMMCLDDTMWVGYSDGRIRVFDLLKISVIWESTKHTSSVHAFCYLSDYVYSAGSDGKIYEWDRIDYHYKRLFFGHRHAIRTLVGFVDTVDRKEKIASGSDDGTIKIWDPSAPSQTVEDVACVKTLEKHTKGVLILLYIPEVGEIWSGGEDNRLCVWHLPSKKCTHTIEIHTTPIVSLQRIDNTVWSGSKNGAIYVFDQETKRMIQTVQEGAANVPYSGSQRFTMCIEAVASTTIYNVWISSVGGSWQCWSTNDPNLSYKMKSVQLPTEPYESASRERNNDSVKLQEKQQPEQPSASRRRKIEIPSIKAQPIQPKKQDPKKASSPNSQSEENKKINPAANHDEHLRDNVRDIRRLVEETLTANQDEPTDTVSEEALTPSESSLPYVESSICRDQLAEMKKEIRVYKRVIASTKTRAVHAEREAKRERSNRDELINKTIKGTGENLLGKELEKEMKSRRELADALKKSEAENAALKSDLEQIMNTSKKESLDSKQEENRLREQVRTLKREAELNKAEFLNMTNDIAQSHDHCELLRKELEECKKKLKLLSPQ